MASELLDWLLRSTVAMSCGLVVLLASRRMVRRAFGARVAYGFWLLLPVVLLATLAPRPVIDAVPLPLSWEVPIEVRYREDAMAADVAAGVPGSSALLLLWVSGAGFAMMLQWRRQVRFRRALGRLQPQPDGTLRAAMAAAGPVLLGLWQPRIVLPPDFDERYAADERQLVLAHENVHLGRRDVWANAAMTLGQCLYWFNPLIHLAARRMRLDQEIACDAVVIARFPHARRRYAEAMLRTQLTAGLPVGCTWQSSHPLKERISMLKLSSPSRARRASGTALATCLCLAAGLAVATSRAEPVVHNSVSAGPIAQQTRAPRYPVEALQARQAGDVVLRVLVGVDGRPRDVVVENSRKAGPEPDTTAVDIFEQPAIDAARQWLFQPALRDGEPVEHWVQVPISFRLNEADGPLAPEAGSNVITPRNGD
jgi:TonB family protein